MAFPGLDPARFTVPMLRRAIGLISALLMLELALAAGDLTCATHVSKPVAHQHSDHAASTSATPLHGVDLAESSQGCEVPSRRDCCAALASCGPSIGLIVTIRVQELESIDLPLNAHALDTPASLTLSPDPPPPKA